MTNLAWEKSPEKRLTEEKLKNSVKSERIKFLVGGVLILGAVIYLLVSGTLTNSQYFIMVDDVVSNPVYVDQTVRLTGAVEGDSIQYDAETGNLSFTIVNLPKEYDDLGQALHDAVKNKDATRLDIFMADTTMPDLLQHEAQAILTGSMADDGTFYATELNLKCPTRFEENMPELASQNQQE